MKYEVTKTYGHNLGLSCTFRQPNAERHCRFLHGYSLQVSVTFAGDRLDFRNWLIDFGALKALKKQLEDMFDHKTVIAANDPFLNYFKQGQEQGVLQLVVLPEVGCEAFAERIYWLAHQLVTGDVDYHGRVFVKSVTVSEHGANSATYNAELPDDTH